MVPLVSGGRWAPGRTAVSVLAAGTLAMAAACGLPAGAASASSHGSSAATASTTAAASGSGATTGPLAFSACMRAHGLPEFPDLSGGGMQFSNPNGQTAINGVVLKESFAQFQTARQACQSTLGAAITNGAPNPSLQQAMAYSHCMQSHGVPNFPDPKVNGGVVTMQMGNSGIDSNSPQFQTAQTACQSVLSSGLPAGSGAANGGNA